MNILIIGCDRTGTLLASRLQQAGHDVALIDRDPAHISAFVQETGFSGLTHAGLPIDLDTLRAGGIESSDAVFALTDDDTVNIMVAQIARQKYRIRRVWALVRDPGLKEAYGRCFSIWTVCPGELAADSLFRSLADEGPGAQFSFGGEAFRLEAVPLPHGAAGRALSALPAGTGTVAGLLRAGTVVLAAEARGETLRADDRLLLLRRCSET